MPMYTLSEKVSSMLEGRTLDQASIFSTVCNMILFPVESAKPDVLASELRIYSSATIRDFRPPEAILDLGLPPEVIARANSSALLGLAVGAELCSSKVEPNGDLVMTFSNGLTLTVSGVSDTYEDAWVLLPAYESEQQLPYSEIHCSSSGEIDEYVIG